MLALPVHALFLTMASAVFTGHDSTSGEKRSKGAASPTTALSIHNPGVAEKLLGVELVPVTVPVPRAGAGALFLMGRTPITNAQYGAFLAACPEIVPPPWWSNPSFSSPAQPVVGITWHEASAYCAWLSATTGGTWRLPTEAEWELAMSGGLVAAATPWGEEIPEGEISDGLLEGPWETGRGTPNPYGLLDPGTVVHEWCLDWREPEARRASRGGSWRHRIRWSSPSARSSLPPDYRYSDYGFRVLLEAPPSLTGCA
jgi:formylglycine-generating enzyme required for sulfatase activity